MKVLSNLLGNDTKINANAIVLKDKNNKVYNLSNWLEGKIAWINPDSSVNFSGQTITLNTSDYDILTILYYDYRANKRMQSITIKKGENANLTSIFLTDSQLYMASRQMDYVDDTHYTFNNCSSITNKSITTLNSSSPAQCIPVIIIAKKLNLF